MQKALNPDTKEQMRRLRARGVDHHAPKVLSLSIWGTTDVCAVSGLACTYAREPGMESQN